MTEIYCTNLSAKEALELCIACSSRNEKHARNVGSGRGISEDGDDMFLRYVDIYRGMETALELRTSSFSAP
jgi:hypothetical protein